MRKNFCKSPPSQSIQPLLTHAHAYAHMSLFHVGSGMVPEEVHSHTNILSLLRVHSVSLRLVKSEESCCWGHGPGEPGLSLHEALHIRGSQVGLTHHHPKTGPLRPYDLPLPSCGLLEAALLSVVSVTDNQSQPKIVNGRFQKWIAPGQ